MSAVKPIALISAEDYLAGELLAKRKHEFSAGRVYAMAGGSNAHNSIASSAIITFGSKLRGRRCQAFNSDTKVRVRLATHTRFYYPDAMIVCEPNPGSDTYQDRPVVIVEVLSASTRRIDEGEKRDAYLSIPTLAAYLLIETTWPRVVAHQRDAVGGFVEQLYEGLDAVVPLQDVGVTLALADLYDRVDFTAAAEAEQLEED